MKRSHCKLSTRFTNTLRRNNASCQALFHLLTSRQVHSITKPAKPQWRLAGHRTADLNSFQPKLFDLVSDLVGNQFALSHNHFIRNRINDVRTTHSTTDRIRQADFHLFAAINNSTSNTPGGSAILTGNNHVLANIRKLASQVPRVSCLESSVRQSLSSTMCRTEILKNGQTFSKVRFDRGFDDLATWLGHQTTHTGELPNLFLTTPSTRVRH